MINIISEKKYNVKYDLLIDPVGFDKKPEGYQIGKMNNRFKNLKKNTYDFSEIVEAIENGKTIVFANLEDNEEGFHKGRNNDLFINTRFVVLDFDDGLRINEALKICDNNGITPTIVYKTFSHKPEHHKFRLVFKFNEFLKVNRFKYCWFVLSKLFDYQNDENAKDSARIYFSTNKGVEMADESNTVSLFDDIQRLAEEMGLEPFCEFENKSLKKETEIKKDKKYVNKLRKSFKGSPKKLEDARAKFKSLDIVKKFEGGQDWDKYIGYEMARSLMFVYDLLVLIDDFFATFKKHWPDYLDEWVYYHEHSLERGYDGHTHTKSILSKLGILNRFQQNLSLYEGEKIELDDYIQPEHIEAIFNSLDNGTKVLLKAFTGTGKTYNIIKYAQQNDKKIVFLSPYYPTTKQTEAQYKHPKTVGFYGRKRVEIGDENVIIATYDKAGYIADNISDDEFVVVIDEAHNIVAQNNFRQEAMESIRQLQEVAKAEIHLTASPIGLPNDYDKIFDFQSERDLGKAFIINSDDINGLTRKVVDNSCEDFIDLIRINNKEYQDKIKSDLVKVGAYNSNEILILNSDLKDSDGFKEILNHERIPEGVKLVISTSILDDGVNIKNENIGSIYFFNSIDINSLMQFPNRCREGFKAMYIFNNLKDNQAMFNLQGQFEYIRDQTQQKADRIQRMYEVDQEAIENKLYLADTQKIRDGLSNLLSPDFIIFNSKKDCYEVDERAILCKLYMKLCGRVTGMDMERVLRDYVGFKDIDHINVNGLELEDDEDDFVDYSERFAGLLQDDLDIICTAIRVAIDQHGFTVDKWPKYHQSHFKRLKSKYPEINALVKSEKKSFKKIVLIYGILKEHSIDKFDAMEESIRLYCEGVNPKTLETKILVAIAFYNENILRKPEQKVLADLQNLSGHRLNYDQARDAIDKILGQYKRYIAPFLECFFEIDTSRDGERCFVEIGPTVDLDNIFGIDFSALKEKVRCKDLQNSIATTKSAKKELQKMLLG